MQKGIGALDTNFNEWCLISVYGKTNEVIKESLLKEVKKETNIRVERIDLVSKNYYIAKLTDDNVNNIKRDEFQLLNFFTPDEARKIPLTYSTKQFLRNHSHLI